MPAASTRSTLARHWELLRLLPNGGSGISAKEICRRLNEAGHDVTKRTIERDLLALESVFPIRCNDKSQPYGWHWMRDAPALLPGIAVGEALTLRMVEDFMRPLMPAAMLKGLEARFSQARLKLDALQDEVASARWLGKVANVQPDMQLLPPAVDAAILETVQSALLEDMQLQCRYYSAHSDWTGNHTLNPLGLVQRGQITYLVATSAPHSDVRLFALHRIRSADILRTPCIVPPGFTLQGYVDSGAMAFGIPTPITLKAWITNDLARLLAETPLSTDMQLEPEGEGKLLTAKVKDTWQLRWWALSHAGSLVVREPLALRDELTAQLRRALGLYQQEAQGDAVAELNVLVEEPILQC